MLWLVSDPQVNGCAWCNPTTPGTPFATPLLAVCDTIRVIVCLVGAYIIIRSIPAAIRSSVVAGQRQRMAGLGMFALMVINTEVNRLGDWPSPRLAIAVAAVTLAALGMRSYRCKELPAQPRQNAGGDAV